MVARALGEAVYRSVEWFVRWGLDQRRLEGVESLGVDEIHWGCGLRADNFLTVIYRHLWPQCLQAPLQRGFGPPAAHPQQAPAMGGCGLCAATCGNLTDRKSVV